MRHIVKGNLLQIYVSVDSCFFPEFCYEFTRWTEPPHCTCAGPNVLSASDVAWRQPQEWASADGIDAVTHSRGVLRSFGEVRKLRNNLLRTGLARPTLKRQTRKWGGFIPWISVWCWPLIYEVPLQYVAACYTIEASSVFQMGVLVPLGTSRVPKRVHH